MIGVRRALPAVAAAAVLLAGCGLGDGLYNVPLPGGADLGSNPYTVTVKFADALDLVPQSAVKVNDVAVGRVTKIALETANGKVADVQVELNRNVELPANAIASVDQTSLLGEKYVSLGPPLSTAATGRLRGGDVIPVARTTQGVEVETVLGALSEVLNGGGVGQLNDISHSLNTALDGHEGAARDLIQSMGVIVADLNEHKSSITNALDALDTLATTLRRNDKQLTNVLTNLAPGIAELAKQRRQLVGALKALDTLSDATVSTLAQSKQQIVDDLTALAPVLDNLAKAGRDLPNSLQLLLTYPFPDSAARGIVGDYVNAWVVTTSNTPGGTVVRPATARASAGRSAASAPVPAGLLPATSSAAPGLPSTLSTSGGG